ncbi:NAD(P)H-dependent oxidoreductase subunit E [bacterium]|nr:MAG: NAD(P)H-dependent oxidoreductase subunit E [bacterium]
MLAFLDDTLDKHNKDKAALVQVLLDVNARFNYLPEDAVRYVSEVLEIPLAKAYQVATFYTAFSLTPRGKHIVKVCMGTACHAKGAPRVLDEIERRLGIKNGETTGDLRYSLETVNCLGCCALGPVVTIDETYYHADPQDVQSLFDKLEEDESANG